MNTNSITSPAPPPPLVTGLPILGSALVFASDPMGFLLKQYHQHGPVFRVKVPGETITVMAGRNANKYMSTIGRDNFSSKGLWGDFSKEVNSNTVLTCLDGALHAKHRKVMKKGYSTQVFEDNLDLIVSTTESMLIAQPENVSIESVRFFRKMISTQLGLALNGYAPYREFDDLLTFTNTVLNVTVAQRKPKFLLKMPAYVKAKHNSFKLAKKLIKLHKENKIIGSKDNFVNNLLAAIEKDPTLHNETELLVAVIGPYLAGMDTVANTCAFTLYALLKNEDLYQRTKSEVVEVLRDEAFSLSLLRKMPILRGVIMETMRLYPVAPMLQRLAANDFEFAGHRIKKGTKIIVATTLSHHLPEFFAEPEKFDISRYSRPRREHIQPHVYTPHGQGPHICLGAKLGEVQIMTILALTLNMLNIRFSNSNYELKSKLDPLATPQNLMIKVSH